MKSTRKQKKPMSAENIARLADREKDVSRFFTNAGNMMGPIQRVNVQFLSRAVQFVQHWRREVISRQAVIKTLIRQALDQHYLAAARRSATK